MSKAVSQSPQRWTEENQTSALPAAAITYARRAALAASILFDKKWKVHLLCAMRSGPVRLGQLARLIPSASKKVLAQHLRQLTADGIVVRTDKSDVVLHVEYALSESSRQDTVALLDNLANWSLLHSESERL